MGKRAALQQIRIIISSLIISVDKSTASLIAESAADRLRGVEQWQVILSMAKGKLTAGQIIFIATLRLLRIRTSLLLLLNFGANSR